MKTGKKKIALRAPMNRTGQARWFDKFDQETRYRFFNRYCRYLFSGDDGAYVVVGYPDVRGQIPVAALDGGHIMRMRRSEVLRELRESRLRESEAADFEYGWLQSHELSAEIEDISFMFE